MKTTRVLLCAFFVCLTPLAIRAQTWVGGAAGNGSAFNVADNWNPSGVPASNADLIFDGSNTNTFVSFNTLPYTANTLSFTSTNAARAYTLSGNGNTLSIAGGVTSAAGGGVTTFNMPIALTANQTWTTGANVVVNNNLSGAFALTKSGSGYLALNGNNSYSGGTTITAGTLYLGNTNSISGTITLQSGGALGTSYSEVSLSNAVSFASGATFGGSLNNDRGELELSGTVTLGSTSMTMNIVNADVRFVGTLTGPSGTALTVHSDGSGVAILAGTATNIDSITADHAAVGFGSTTALPASIQATSGGYVSVADLGGATPADTAVIDRIAAPAAFNGTLGFDTGDLPGDTPHIYSAAIDLAEAGFTSGNVSLGTATKAVLTGVITPPGQSYDFAGPGTQGGTLFVQSALADHGGTTSVTISSPDSGGITGGGMGVIFQGANTFTGNLTVTKSGAILDSASALPSKNFSMGANSYVGYTENATNYTSFADFASHLQSGYTATSVLGIDTGSRLADYLAGNALGAARTITDTINLSTYNPVYLGTFTGVTIDSSATITAPNDGVLRLVALSDHGDLTINSALTSGNVTSVVAGMSGSEGAVVLNAANTYTGGTTLLGGSLLVGNNSALGSGAVTVDASSGDRVAIGAAGGNVSLSNNIAVTGNLTLGAGNYDDDGNLTSAGAHTLTVNGVISGSSTRVTIDAPAVLNGANTYTGGTYVRADTTVNSDTGLGTNFVNPGYSDTSNSTKSTLTFTSANPRIGGLADAGSFINNGGTGNISLGSGVTNLTVTQTSSQTFSGQITSVAAAGLIKLGGQMLTLSGNNTYTGATTINGGAINLTGANGQLSGTSAVAISGGTLNVGDNFVAGVANRINSAATLTLGGATGSGNFNLVRGSSGTTAQSLASLTIGTGTNTITGSGSGGNVPTLTFSGATPYVRNAGGFVNFQGNTTIITSFTNAPSGTGNVAGSGSDAILVGATLQQSNFIAAASGTIATAASTAVGANTWTAGKNMNVTAATPTIATAADVNSVRFNTATTLTLPAAGTSNIASGMILLPAGVGASTITGGTIAGPGGSDLLVINYGNGPLTIASTIADGTSATGLTKTGSGSVILSGANTYTGPTTITAGTLSLGSGAALNGTPVTIFGNSATLNLNSNATTISKLEGSGGGTVSLGSATLTVNQSTNSTFVGAITGTGGLTKSGSGILTIGGSGSTYNGATTVSDGTLRINASITSSTFSVLTGATLGGSGTVGATTFQSGSYLAPGNSAGTLTFSNGLTLMAGSALNFELGTASDKVVISGGVFSVTGPVTLNLTDSGGFAAGSYSLLDFSAGGVSTNGFTASDFSLGTPISGFTYSLAISGNTLVLTAVPEPSTYAAIAGLLGLGVAVWRRRRVARADSSSLSE